VWSYIELNGYGLNYNSHSDGHRIQLSRFFRSFLGYKVTIPGALLDLGMRIIEGFIMGFIAAYLCHWLENCRQQ